MPSPLTHVVAGATIAHLLYGDHYAATIVYSLLPDADHLYIFAKTIFTKPSSIKSLWDDDGLLYARTIFHEFLGLIFFLLTGLAIGLFISREHGKLFISATLMHLFLDFATGASKPLRPLNNSMLDFRLPWKWRIIEEAGIITLFLLAWIC